MRYGESQGELQMVSDKGEVLMMSHKSELPMVSQNKVNQVKWE